MLVEVFVVIVECGSLSVVVEGLDMLCVMVMCYLVEMEVWFGVCLLYWIMCCIGLILVGEVMFVCCC